MHHATRLTAAAAALALLAVPGATGAQPQTFGTCLDGLQALDRRMDEDGFWLGGYRASHNWTGIATPLGTEPNMGARAGINGLSGPEIAGIAPPRPGEESRNPFAGLDWRMAPAHALRTLFGAAHFLGQSGREEACRAVLTEAERDYAAYVGQLRQAGVEPSEIRSWRQKQLILARPVADEVRPLPIEAIEGSDIRNLQDELLGQVADVVLDPRSGDVAWLVVGRRGFLGLGREQVAVPWRALRITPGLDTFVLDMSRPHFDAAPRLDPAAAGESELRLRYVEEIRSFWSWHTQAADRGR